MSQPRLVAREEASSSSSSSSSAGVPTSPIRAFQWSDAGATVKVYAEVPSFASLSDDHLHVSSDSRSFELRVASPDGREVHVLRKAGLYADIAGATAKKGKTKVVVTLKKAEGELSWFELTAAKPLGGGDDE